VKIVVRLIGDRVAEVVEKVIGVCPRRAGERREKRAERRRQVNCALRSALSWFFVFFIIVF
jgi:hypothetical protein